MKNLEEFTSTFRSFLKESAEGKPESEGSPKPYESVYPPGHTINRPERTPEPSWKDFKRVPKKTDDQLEEALDKLPPAPGENGGERIKPSLNQNSMHIPPVDKRVAQAPQAQAPQAQAPQGKYSGQNFNRLMQDPDFKKTYDTITRYKAQWKSLGDQIQTQKNWVKQVGDYWKKNGVSMTPELIELLGGQEGLEESKVPKTIKPKAPEKQKSRYTPEAPTREEAVKKAKKEKLAKEELEEAGSSTRHRSIGIPNPEQQKEIDDARMIMRQENSPNLKDRQQAVYAEVAYGAVGPGIPTKRR